MPVNECLDSVRWHYKTLSSNLNPASSVTLIAPSRNLLTREAFDARHQTIAIDEKVQKIVQEHDLFLPQIISSTLPLTNHCVSMSMHFVKTLRDTKDIAAAATHLSKGTSIECAKTTVVCNQLFESNLEKLDDHISDKEYSHNIYHAVANTLELGISEEINLKLPFDKLLEYLSHDLSSGDYLISWPSHVVTLIKDQEGNLFVYDSSCGTISLDTTDGQDWFIHLLQKHKTHLAESLYLLKIKDSQDDNSLKIKHTEIVNEEQKPDLTFEKRGDGRWGEAQFKWRDKTYRLPWDSQTGYIYNEDSIKLLRTKFMLVIPRTLFDTTIRTIYHVAMTAFRTLALPFAMIQGKDKTIQQLQKIGESFTDIFAAQLYGIVNFGVAIYGLFKPLDGRRLYGYFERCLNRQNDRVDIRKKFYTAPCFKPWNFNAQHNQQATVEALKKIVLQYEYFKGVPMLELFFGWRHSLRCIRSPIF